MSKRMRANLLLLVTAIIWGMSIVAQRVAMDDIGPFTFTGLRLVLGAIAVLPVVLLGEKPDASRRRNTIIGGIACGLVLAMAQNMQQIGIAVTGNAGKSAFLSGLYMVIVPIGGLLLGKKTSIFTWIAVAVAAVGLYLISLSGDEGFSGGDWLLLLDACVWACHILTIDHFSGKVEPIRMSALQFLVGGGVSLLCAVLTEDISVPAITSAAVPIFYAGFLSTGLGFTFQLLGQRDAEPACSAIILSLEAPVSVIGGILLLDEVITLRGGIGCLVILCGVLLSQGDLIFHRKA